MSVSFRRSVVTLITRFVTATAAWEWHDVPARVLFSRADIPQIAHSVARFIPDHELAALMAAVDVLPDPYQRAALIVARWSGARPDEIRRLALELGHCLRTPAEGPCECDLVLTCSKFLTTSDYAPRLRARLAVEQQLIDDAATRGWDREVERHTTTRRGSNDCSSSLARTDRTELPASNERLPVDRHTGSVPNRGSRR